MEKISNLLQNSHVTDKLALMVFKQLDKDRNGFITPDELSLLFSKFTAETGIPQPPNFIIKQTMKKFDTNRDGAISFDEFKVFIYTILKLQTQQMNTNGSYQGNQNSYQGQGQYQGNKGPYPGQGQYQGNQGSYSGQGHYQGGQSNNQSGNPSDHFPPNAQGLGQGRDVHQGGQNQYQGSNNQYQGNQGQYQGGQGNYQGGHNQYQGNQGQNQGNQNYNQGGNPSDHFPPNTQGLGQGRDAYQGGQGQYQGSQNHQQGGNQYQGQYQGGQGNYHGGNQYQGNQGQYQGSQGSYQGGQGQYQGGYDQNQGRNQYQGEKQNQRSQDNFLEHFPSNSQGVGQGRDHYQA